MGLTSLTHRLPFSCPTYDGHQQKQVTLRALVLLHGSQSSFREHPPPPPCVIFHRVAVSSRGPIPRSSLRVLRWVNAF